MAAQPVPRRPPFLTRLLAEDPDLLDRVRAARACGISLRRFEGWEPTTYYQHDDGRLVTSTPEPEWDDVEQGWMLALAAYEAERCPHCGGDLRETTDPANADAYRHQPALECYRCRAFAQSHDAYTDQDSRSFLHVVPMHPRRSR